MITVWYEVNELGAFQLKFNTYDADACDIDDMSTAHPVLTITKDDIPVAAYSVWHHVEKSS